MPRGAGSGGRGKKNYKGQRRHFTSQDEIKAAEEKERKDREWREKKGELTDEDEDDEGAKKKSGDEDDSDSSESEEEAAPAKAKGIEGLIEIENPNRVKARTKKVTEIGTDQDSGKPQPMSRREREELEKQQASERYRKMHEAGKTDEARSDLARLALIRKQREEAAKKRELEKTVASQKTKAK